MKKIEKFFQHLISICKAKRIIGIPQLVSQGELLSGRVALITGGSSGIGKAIAEAYIKNGCKVIVAGRDEQRLQECADFLGKDAAERIRYLVMDVKKTHEFEIKIKEAAAYWGKIDILVNSAGVLARNHFLNMTENEYDTIMDTNVKGLYFLSQAAAKYMIENKVRGNILNITSSSALRPAWTPYQISKWSVRGLTLGLADSLIPYGITVNALAPGPVATPMLRMKENDNLYKGDSPSERYAKPEEIANMAAILVSDMGKLIVGDTVYMTGGSGTITLHN